MNNWERSKWTNDCEFRLYNRFMYDYWEKWSVLSGHVINDMITIMNNWFGKCGKKNLLKYHVNDMILIGFFGWNVKTHGIVKYLNLFELLLIEYVSLSLKSVQRKYDERNSVL